MYASTISHTTTPFNYLTELLAASLDDYKCHYEQKYHKQAEQ